MSEIAGTHFYGSSQTEPGLGLGCTTLHLWNSGQGQAVLALPCPHPNHGDRNITRCFDRENVDVVVSRMPST